MTTGDPDGFTGIAIPVSSRKVMLPRALKADKGLVIGRTPYDKVNILAVDHEYNKEIANLHAIQYTLTGSSRSISNIRNTSNNLDESTEKNLAFFKGILIAIDDNKWPSEYKDMDIITSTEDRKIHSSATTKAEIKPSPGSKFTISGILTPVNYYKPGVLVGIPNHMQEAAGGDYDGDPVICQVYDRNDPRYALIQTTETRYYNDLNPKIDKSFTQTNNGILRFKEIMDLKNSRILEQSTYSYNMHVAFSESTKQCFIDRLFQKYGDDIKDMIRTILDKENCSLDTINAKQIAIELCLKKAIKVGTDSYKTFVDKNVYNKFLVYFNKIISILKIPQPIYFKSLLNKLTNGPIDLQLLKEQAYQQKEHYQGTYVFDVTCGIIDNMKYPVSD
jgi:hypothetical protein